MQNVKTIKTTSATTKTIAMSAMFAALVTVTTAFIKIPTPVGGYVHPGDSMVYLAASVLPGPFGLIAAAVGGALGDHQGAQRLTVLAVQNRAQEQPALPQDYQPAQPADDHPVNYNNPRRLSFGKCFL